MSFSHEFLADTYQSRARRYGCRGGRQVSDNSLIQAFVKPFITHLCGDAIRAKRLHGEPRADHRGRMQVQVHVLPEGRESVVQRRREGPPAAMASPGHIVSQVPSLRVHLHRGYKHVVWGRRKNICCMSITFVILKSDIKLHHGLDQSSSTTPRNARYITSI